jgi:hypothetical protein
MVMERVWTDIPKPDLYPNPPSPLCPPTKVSMGMALAPNPNPSDIRISMGIHVFTNYVHEHNILEHNNDIY